MFCTYDNKAVAKILAEELSEQELNALGKATGQSARLRIVTPFRLVASLLVALGGAATESIADLLREFNFNNGTTVAYKAFYNRLSHRGFAAFMRAVVERLLVGFACRVLEPGADSPLARFEDIVIQDGTSFVVKPVLSATFPGRFKNVDPAAVELHATFSGFGDDIVRAVLSPDTAGERQYLPEPEELTDRLLLADRGYPSMDYFEKLDAAGASFVIRLTRSYKPRVLAVHHKGATVPLPTPIPLQQFLRENPVGAFDLDIELRRGKHRYACRLIVLPGKEKWRTRLCTNLPRAQFPATLVARLYRFRWQVELLFKEWKSYANLHRFDTGNKHIVEGLIWASLAAAILKRFLAHAAQITTGVPISTRRVAMCARLFLRPLLSSLTRPRSLRALVASALTFLATNAQRSNPKRERARGRLNAGLTPCLLPASVAPPDDTRWPLAA